MKKKDARWMARRMEAALHREMAARAIQGRVRVPWWTMRKKTVAKIVRLITQTIPRRFAEGALAPRWEKFASGVNASLATPHGGLEICDGAIECPACGQEKPTIATPQEWTRRRDGRWKVTSYWPGMADCCHYLLYHDFDCARAIDRREMQPTSAAEAA